MVKALDDESRPAQPNLWQTIEEISGEEQIFKAPKRQQPTSVGGNDEAQRHSQAKIIDLFGTIDFDPEWDYKADRKLRTYAKEKRRVDVQRHSGDEQT